MERSLNKHDMNDAINFMMWFVNSDYKHKIDDIFGTYWYNREERNYNELDVKELYQKYIDHGKEETPTL